MLSDIRQADGKPGTGQRPEIRVQAKVVQIRELTDTIYLLQLHCKQFAPSHAGQFVNLEVPGFFLRRPLAIADLQYFGDGSADLTVIAARVGAGTRALGELPIGTEITLLGPLGNGFDITRVIQTKDSQPVLVGGGAGIPPLYRLAQELVALDVRPQVCLGFRNAAAVYYEREFAQLGCDVTVATEDGSYGVRGFVTNALPGTALNVYACGPEGMLRAVKYWVAQNMPVAENTASEENVPVTGAEQEVIDAQIPSPTEKKNSIGTNQQSDTPVLPVRVQLSLEAHMGCGFGACLGCTVHTVHGLKRVCVDGPVFESAEVLID